MPLHKTEALYTRHALYTRGDGIPRQTNICTFFGEVIDCGKINIGSSCRTTARHLKQRDHHVGRLVEEKKAYVVNGSQPSRQGL
ncbi:hypothetical protein J6590_045749 [Homalodisca vitripennis]|nr:hypothetical protein J6590_045749 [Homalodisca vitripennis]